MKVKQIYVNQKYIILNSKVLCCSYHLRYQGCVLVILIFSKAQYPQLNKK